MEQLNGRQHEIVALARSVGRVVVEDLAARFSVTPQTIRKDLNELCERRMLSRVHGGATIASGVENVGYDARRFIAQDEKRAIGEAAARIIPNGSSLFINIGTTTEEVARALGRHEELLVITNNLNVATLLYRHPGVDVIVAGGPVRRSDAGIVGGPAVDFIKQFKVDYAVIGVSAIDEEGALLDYDYREVMVSQAIMENAREIVLVADRSKLARSAPIRVGRLSQVDTFVTDRIDSEELAELCRRHEVRVVETGLRDEVQSEAAQ
ncbi:DeoR family glycerol-3-phosphate regulon repressor [Methylopila capsulata]|uniref:DeoR family glycerol-3-phosphate regulon repressor n=1 Tax=Methylopila capsulata TaxID=61654 RepID=A0A9W6MT36_9HYPH|nr:DeoR/GlpR family DNA-binding transcription regulator [Methylopila capsulata]MBM7852639.1 DeoR family glycerol-3-phosphate regulon repressor [Methylopila capsulata]GLK56847.1 DeoR family transcriptional regulator [Methylopila capsulata]